MVQRKGVSSSAIERSPIKLVRILRVTVDRDGDVYTYSALNFLEAAGVGTSKVRVRQSLDVPDAPWSV